MYSGGIAKKYTIKLLVAFAAVLRVGCLTIRWFCGTGRFTSAEIPCFG